VVRGVQRERRPGLLRWPCHLAGPVVAVPPHPAGVRPVRDRDGPAVLRPRRPAPVRDLPGRPVPPATARR